MNELLRIADIFAWPIVAIVIVRMLLPSMTQLLSGAKIRVSVAGQGLDTTLPELQRVFDDQRGEPLSDEQKSFLQDIDQRGPKLYENGCLNEDEKKRIIRPLRNCGLILAKPRNAYLRDARLLEISDLGRLYLKGLNREAGTLRSQVHGS